MNKSVKWMFGISALLLLLGFIGLTEFGQNILRGSPSELAKMDHFKRDDVAMGAGLAPVVYCIFPGVVIAAFATIKQISNRFATKR